MKSLLECVKPHTLMITVVEYGVCVVHVDSALCVCVCDDCD